MSRVAAAGEEPVLAAPLRDTAVTAAVLALTAVAGVLLGTSCALLAALAVTGLQRRWTTEKPGRSAHPPVPADRR
jgi:hypothetical protein